MEKKKIVGSDRLVGRLLASMEPLEDSFARAGYIIIVRTSYVMISPMSCIRLSKTYPIPTLSSQDLMYLSR